MTGTELKAIRTRLGLTVTAFGRALGYDGPDRNISRLIRRYEAIKTALPIGAQLRAHGVELEAAADERARARRP